MELVKLDKFVEQPRKCGCSCHNFQDQSICCSCDCDLDILVLNPPKCVTIESIMTKNDKGEDNDK